ncbi:carbonic anhydrase 4-like [Trematomus bernacchii]|uniref:carbonic anhydrase 4-like n=1 Tax=Trematomus bernacchii TaxID=40690 RepID=UPI00146BC596|nr:carbonic anhydrase 4-like [Trematomus bernacchii]
MHLSALLLCLSLGALVKCATGSEWCYTHCDDTPSTWENLHGASCGGKRQSPIDIDTNNVHADPHLLNFNFVNFSSNHVIKSIINNGHTVKLNLDDGKVEVSGGGLNDTYSTIQLHFHWGDTEYHPGSEHKIDGHRYPMEMHIVSMKKGLTVQQATEKSEGIAAMAFFIKATEDGDVSPTWSNLTSYLTNVIDTEVNMEHDISIDDLIKDVDLTKFYRYMGSLTTPNCSEAVVWTVFHEPIIIHKSLIEKFPKNAGFRNVYRPTQALNGRQVLASPATPLPSHPWCYHDHCEYTQSEWSRLPNAYCAGESQSPINIAKSSAVKEEKLGAFHFEKFDDKHVIEKIINTGHTVKCVLKEGVEVSGGGLGHVFSTLQLHFHWGTHDSEGSEHTVDSKRYPMEMHIVNKRKDLTLEKALQTTDGLAVLGFFIEATSAKERSRRSSSEQGASSSDMDAWKKLTSYLSAIKNISSEVNVTEEISIDDLLGSVNRESYYRYNGSLTTPSCNQAVVWTVFKESIKVDENLMTMFPTETGYHNVFRSAQGLHSRTVYTTAAAARAPVSISLLLACLCAFHFKLHF